MRKVLIGLVAVGLMLSSCSKPEAKTTVISADIWVGASPLYYAHSAGWLDEANFKLLIAPSITENLRNFTSKAADMVTGTNREYKVLKEQIPDLAAVIVYDRSSGGDMILANRTIEQIKEASSFELYLEKNTVSEEIWDYFVRYEGIDQKRFTLHSRFQEELSMMKSDEKSPTQVIVTYNPHNIPLEANGYSLLVSSKDDRYLIVDGIYTTKQFAMQNRERLKKLNASLTKAVDVYHKDPKGFYEKVKTYLGNPSYEEFMKMTQNIEWLLPLPSPEMQKQLERSGYPIEELI